MSNITAPPNVRRRAWLIVGGIIVAWFALAEVATQGWYYAHESKLKKNPIPGSGEELLAKVKSFATDENGYQIREDDAGEAAREMLNCSYAKTVSWVSAGRPTAVTVIRWDDRSSAGGVESSHNPGVCLAAAGWTVGPRDQLGFQEYCGTGTELSQWQVSRPNLQMLAYSAVFRRFSGAPTIERSSSRNDIRWGSVLSGRRDAPVLVMLVYIAATPEEQAAARGKLDEIMKATFCTPAS